MITNLTGKLINTMKIEGYKDTVKKKSTKKRQWT